jgi:hypothetical protein
MYYWTKTLADAFIWIAALVRSMQWKWYILKIWVVCFEGCLTRCI